MKFYFDSFELVWYWLCHRHTIIMYKYCSLCLVENVRRMKSNFWQSLLWVLFVVRTKLWRKMLGSLWCHKMLTAKSTVLHINHSYLFNKCKWKDYFWWCDEGMEQNEKHEAVYLMTTSKNGEQFFFFLLAIMNDKIKNKKQMCARRLNKKK